MPQTNFYQGRPRSGLLAFILLMIAFIPAPSQAALNPGDTAPDFTAQASLNGDVSSFTLSDALKQGPVVLYFYPAAFTQGCTTEAHDFAEAADEFKAEGATIIGVSHDSIATLQKFSTSECRGKFAVVSDEDGSIMKAYDSVMTSVLGLADRASYVITPDDKVLYVYSALNPDQHVANTLEALKAWRSDNP